MQSTRVSQQQNADACSLPSALFFGAPWISGTRHPGYEHIFNPNQSIEPSWKALPSLKSSAHSNPTPHWCIISPRKFPSSIQWDTPQLVPKHFSQFKCGARYNDANAYTSREWSYTSTYKEWNRADVERLWVRSELQVFISEPATVEKRIILVSS